MTPEAKADLARRVERMSVNEFTAAKGRFERHRLLKNLSDDDALWLRNDLQRQAARRKGWRWFFALLVIGVFGWIAGVYFEAAAWFRS